MPTPAPASAPAPGSLAGKVGLVLGIANECSIATGCTRAFAEAGATLVAIYLHENVRSFVEAATLPFPGIHLLPCDVREPGQLETTFDAVRTHHGRLDFLLLAIAFSPRDDLHGRVTDCVTAGFAMAMEVSCHCFIRMARLAEPLMQTGGAPLAVPFYGSERVVEHYNLMGSVKAALESSVRCIAAELGRKGIRARAISPGPIKTRAVSGIDRFDELVARAAAATPERKLVTVDDVGALAAFLVGDGARRITGTVIPVDGGQHVPA